ncbi:MAG: EAL domain-containing protein [Aquabacterium sp.]|nr:EAL domain-containing protein [Aquabacterium sp.]
MISAHSTTSDWWWLLASLLVVGVLMSVVRSLLRSRAHADGLSPQMTGSVAPQPLPLPKAELSKLASHIQDPLTGLATRLCLEDKLSAAALRAETKQCRLAVLYIDLDGFKPINDSFGYVSGDTLLREVAQRLQCLGRSTDTFARMGGDEFLMLLDGDPDHSSSAMVADRIRQNLQMPYTIDGKEVRLSCSIGIVLFPDHGPRAKLIARADAAMTAAKLAGGNMHCFFDPSMDHDAEGAIEMQRDLRQSIESHTGLTLHYQPKLDGRTGCITGAEALLRWQHPVKGMISPVVFIPIAERFGLIGDLGQWVTVEACRQVREWLDAGLRMPVAVNLSVHQLRQTDLVEKIQEALARHSVPPELIAFEITESAAMEDAQASLLIFERIAQTGVSLSIDDFGTGYSSLSYLRKLPANQLKIDRSFVQDVDVDVDAKAIVSAVIKLAHALGLEVVAEGVETTAQQRILIRLGCDQLQGYLFAKPMPAEALLPWTRDEALSVHQAVFDEQQFDQEGHEPKLTQ